MEDSNTEILIRVGRSMSAECFYTDSLYSAVNPTTEELISATNRVVKDSISPIEGWSRATIDAPILITAARECLGVIIDTDSKVIDVTSLMYQEYLTMDVGNTIDFIKVLILGLDFPIVAACQDECR